MRLRLVPPGEEAGSQAPKGGWWHATAFGDRLTLAYLLLGAAVLALGSLVTEWRGPAVLAVGVSATLVVAVSVYRRRPSPVWPWICIVVAFALFLAGSVAREALHTVGDLTGDRSSAPELISIPGYFCLIAGLLGFSRMRERGTSYLSVVLDALIAAFAMFVITWALLIGPHILEREVPVVVKMVLTAYPSLSILLVGVMLRIVFNPHGARMPAFRMCIVAMVFMFLGSAMYIIADIGLLEVSLVARDLPFGLAFLFAGATAIHPSMMELTEPAPTNRTPSAAPRIAMVAGALFVTALLLAQPREFAPSDRIFTSALFFALCVVVALRIIQALAAAARSERLLGFQANHDILTGLPNRRMLEHHLGESLRAGPVDDTHVALLFLDLDHFKLVNDALGHTRGDRLLVQVAERLGSLAREGDLVYRLGGDEFVVLLGLPVAVSEAVALANRLLQGLKPPIEIDGFEFKVSGSIGLAFASGDDPHAVTEALIRDADTAMHKAKESGRDQVAVFDASMRNQVTERIALEHGLHDAIVQRQFLLEYQPIIGLPHGPSVGMEALVRWAHPTRGLLAPGQFIPIAEDLGRIAEIGDWVLEEAVSQFAAWRRQAPEMERAYISVNLSAAQLQNDAIVQRVGDLLALHGLPGPCLCLEVTESTAMLDPVASASILARLRSLGVGMALDDFGVEYSSLAYLKRLPVTILKIDKSFIDSLSSEDSADSSLIAAVVAMAKSLGVKTVAEGVETIEQDCRLARLGVDSAQGFYYSRPVVADRLLDVTASLAGRRLKLVTTMRR